MTEISISQCTGFRVGHAQNDPAKTGVTVILFPQGARIGVDISGGGPASRETPLASPTTVDHGMHAIVFAGGSAYGLAAADGVMQCLEEHNIGYDTKIALIPLVLQSNIFDLAYGDPKVRPDRQMGYDACLQAIAGTDQRMGNVGAGVGASVGKLFGMNRAMKSGLGIHSVRIGRVEMTAIVVVNAFGDVFDWKTGEKLAGLRTEDRSAMDNTCRRMYEISEPLDYHPANTTIGAVITNAAFSKSQLTKIASMTRNGYARCINPVGTMADGDCIYAASTGSETMDLNLAGTLAAEVMSEAIRKAVLSSRISEEEYLSNLAPF